VQAAVFEAMLRVPWVDGEGIPPDATGVEALDRKRLRAATAVAGAGAGSGGSEAGSGAGAAASSAGEAAAGGNAVVGAEAAAPGGGGGLTSSGYRALLATPPGEAVQRCMGGVEPVADVIARDLSRTFPEHPLFRDAAGGGQAALGRLLRAYALKDEEIGYCQGQGEEGGGKEEEGSCQLWSGSGRSRLRHAQKRCAVRSGRLIIGHLPVDPVPFPSTPLPPAPPAPSAPPSPDLLLPAPQPQPLPQACC
jgi:hypothetical protein